MVQIKQSDSPSQNLDEAVTATLELESLKKVLGSIPSFLQVCLPHATHACSGSNNFFSVARVSL